MPVKKLISLSFLILTPFWAAAADNREVTITQQGKTTVLTEEENELVLKKEAFTIGFFNKAYGDEADFATAIAAFPEDEPLSRVHSGIAVEEVPYLAAGTGMSATDTGYTALFYNPEGHHYLYYQDEQHKRVQLVARKGDWLQLSWTVSAVNTDNEERTFAAAGLENLYLVIFTDADRNGYIDEGELRKLSIRFE